VRIATRVFLWGRVVAMPNSVLNMCFSRMHIPCASYEDGCEQLAAVQARREQRGYKVLGK
jgi:hypothetical protein